MNVASQIESLKEKFLAIKPERRRLILIVSLLVVLVTLASVFKRHPRQFKTHVAEPQNMTVVMPPRQKEGLGDVRTSIDTLTDELTRERAANKQLNEKMLELAQGKKEEEGGQIQTLQKDISSLRQEMKLTQSAALSGVPGSPDKSIPDLPPPIGNPGSGANGPAKPVLPEIHIDNDDDGTDATQASGAGNPSLSGKPIKLASSEAPTAATTRSPANIIGNDVSASSRVSEKNLQYIPAGTILQGILMNGVDAPTSSLASKNPVPILVRLKLDAILPNRVTQDLRECFMIMSGNGVMSSERVEMRSETISCVRSDGGVIETKIDGYAVDSDGKEGMRGTLVTKQGALIARGLLAGFMSGFSSMMTPTTGSNLSLNSSTQSMLTPAFGQAMQAGAMKGLSESASEYSKFFLDMAKQMFPVIELPNGIPITIILVRGTSLSLMASTAKGNTWTNTVMNR